MDDPFLLAIDEARAPGDVETIPRLAAASFESAEREEDLFETVAAVISAIEELIFSRFDRNWEMLLHTRCG